MSMPSGRGKSDPAVWMEMVGRNLRISADPARLAAAMEPGRTDPWRWYCRICGAEGEAADPGTRDEAAVAHLNQAPCGHHVNVGWAESGRLVHVWSYPEEMEEERSGHGR